MPPIYFYVIVFITGVLSSALMMLFVAYCYAPSSITMRERKLKNYMSEEHYLQVRDDYQIFDPNMFDPLAEHLDVAAQSKRKTVNTAEGKFIMNPFIITIMHLLLFSCHL